MTTVQINGQDRSIPDPCSVGDAVVLSGASPDERGVAVAIDGDVVPRSEWGTTMLAEGMRVEVVRAIQGG